MKGDGGCLPFKRCLNQFEPVENSSEAPRPNLQIMLCPEVAAFCTIFLGKAECAEGREGLKRALHTQANSTMELA